MSNVHKTYELASFKALPDRDGKSGRFEAIVSVFGNIDYAGDRVKSGAFRKSIDRWRKTGDPIPIIWSHNWGDPFAHIGYADPKDVEEVAPNGDAPAGLKVAGQLDVTKPFAKQVYDLLKDRRVREWSFAYDVLNETQAEDGANDLLELDLLEAGPTLKGMNPDTATLGVKAQLDRAADRQTSMEILLAALEVDPELAKSLLNEDEEDDLDDADAMLYDPSMDPETADLEKAVADWAADNLPDDVNFSIAKSEDPDTLVVVVASNDDVTFLEFTPTKNDDGFDLGDPATTDDDETIEEKAVDNTAWDGGAAMASCENAADFRSIAFERDNDSDPDTAAHWALPHHKSPGADPNAAGVSAAIGALNGARGGAPALKNEDAARSHLEAHQREAEGEDEDAETAGKSIKAGRVIGAKAAAALKTKLNEAVDVFVAEVNGTEAQTASEEPPATKEIVVEEIDEQKKEIERLNELLNKLAE